MPGNAIINNDSNTICSQYSDGDSDGHGCSSNRNRYYNINSKRYNNSSVVILIVIIKVILIVIIIV